MSTNYSRLRNTSVNSLRVMLSQLLAQLAATRSARAAAAAILAGVDSDDDDSDNGDEGRFSEHCDECGTELEFPYYMSTRIVDYSVCQGCYDGNHKNVTVASACQRISSSRGKERHQEHCGSRRHPFRSIQIEEELTNGEVQNLAFNAFEVGWTPVLLREAIATNIALTVLDIYRLQPDLLSWSAEGGAGFAPWSKFQLLGLNRIMEGIKANNSIVSLFLEIDLAFEWAAERIASIIRKDKSIRFLILRHRTKTEGTMCDVKRNVVLIFEALKDTSLHTFRLRDVDGLSDYCRDAAVEAMLTRPNLKRILANFSNDDTILKDLMEQKKHRWILGWNDPGATNKSRLNIIQEIMSCKEVHEEDQVAALFHFIGTNPGVLPVRVSDVPKVAAVPSPKRMKITVE